MPNVTENNLNLAFADLEKYETNSGDPFLVVKYVERQKTIDRTIYQGFQN